MPKKSMPRPQKAKRPKMRPGPKILKILGIAALILALGAVWLIVRNYQKNAIVEEIESIVGELDRETISLRVPDLTSGQIILDQLRKIEGKSGGSFKIDKTGSGKNSIKLETTIEKNKYQIEIYWEQPKPMEPKKELPPGLRPKKGSSADRKGRAETSGGEPPKLAIVIDDLGASSENERHFLELPFPVTPAIIPHQKMSLESAKLAATMNRPFLIHMPMEPHARKGINPGEGALTAKDAANARKLLARAFQSVPGAAGMNNHMGSQATESTELMAIVMDELAGKNMFFLDSMTSPASVASKAAKKAGIPYAVRDVFIDNDPETEAVEARIKVAVDHALKHGRAIAIGHGRPQTLEALKRWTGKFEEAGVRIVPLTELLHRLEG